MNQRISNPVISLVGPTAIGKTALSLKIAKEFDCEIVSVDSMQVYKYMDIGTAKIRSDEMEGIPHHLIDIIFPDEEYDAAKFVRDCSSAIESICERNRQPLLTGGTGLYLKALVEGLFAGIPEDRRIRENIKKQLDEQGGSKLHEQLRAVDPEAAARIHPNDTSRIIRGLEIYYASGIPWSAHLQQQARNSQKGAVENILQLGLTCDRDILYDRINTRSSMMIDAGLEQEVRGLLKKEYTSDCKSMGAIGYRHMLQYINNEMTMEQTIELLARDTRRYAKRQYTWFNKINGLEWFEVSQEEKILQRIRNWLNTQ